jgi:TPR repeat protein
VVAKKPAAPAPAEPAPAASAAAPTDPNVDLVYGAYQRGMYKTAFDLATKRVQEKNDPKAMTMLGELYANAMGVKRDYARAAEWYKRAAEAGDREGMFALAMLRLSGRGGGTANREEGARWLASAAKLGNPKAAYNLALLYLDGQTFPQDVKRAAELLRVAADAGNPEAQYALATFYKEGTGVEKNIDKAVRLLQAAALADNVDAEVEYAIAMFNGTGTPKNEAAAIALLRKAAKQNNPIAQNRLARVLVTGVGAPMDKLEGLKWHLVAKTAGKGDLMLDEALAQASPEDRAKAQEAARRWLGTK